LSELFDRYSELDETGGDLPQKIEFKNAIKGVNFCGIGHRVAAILGHYLQVLEYYQQSLALQQEIGYHSGEANSWRYLGNAYRCLGRCQQAIEYSQQSLALARSIRVRKQ
jgi:tetratricopeptide (TPR) repeat protein